MGYESVHIYVEPTEKEKAAIEAVGKQLAEEYNNYVKKLAEMKLTGAELFCSEMAIRVRLANEYGKRIAEINNNALRTKR